MRNWIASLLVLFVACGGDDGGDVGATKVVGVECLQPPTQNILAASVAVRDDSPEEIWLSNVGGIGVGTAFTTDGGATWRRVPYASVRPLLIGSDTVVLDSGWRSTDRGATWQSFDAVNAGTPMRHDGLGRLYTFDPGGLINISDDLGDTWTTLGTPPIDSGDLPLRVRGEWIVTWSESRFEFGQLWVTDLYVSGNRGQHWEGPLAAPFRVIDMAIDDGGRLAAVGGSANPEAIYTSVAGVDWTQSVSTWNSYLAVGTEGRLWATRSSTDIGAGGTIGWSDDWGGSWRWGTPRASAALDEVECRYTPLCRPFGAEQLTPQRVHPFGNSAVAWVDGGIARGDLAGGALLCRQGADYDEGLQRYPETPPASVPAGEVWLHQRLWQAGGWALAVDASGRVATLNHWIWSRTENRAYHTVHDMGFETGFQTDVDNWFQDLVLDRTTGDFAVLGNSVVEFNFSEDTGPPSSIYWFDPDSRENTLYVSLGTNGSSRAGQGGDGKYLFGRQLLYHPETDEILVNTNRGVLIPGAAPTNQTRLLGSKYTPSAIEHGGRYQWYVQDGMIRRGPLHPNMSDAATPCTDPTYPCWQWPYQHPVALEVSPDDAHVYVLVQEWGRLVRSPTQSPTGAWEVVADGFGNPTDFQFAVDDPDRIYVLDDDVWVLELGGVMPLTRSLPLEVAP